jgi:hypothetical protein
MKRIEKYIFAKKILNDNNVKTTSDRLTVNNNGDLIFHSKQLKNCILIPPQATKKTIQNIINLQLNII